MAKVIDHKGTQTKTYYMIVLADGSMFRNEAGAMWTTFKKKEANEKCSSITANELEKLK